MRPPQSRGSRPRRIPAWPTLGRLFPALVLGLGLPVLATGCEPRPDAGALPAALERAMGTPRPVAPRLSVLPGYRACDTPGVLCARSGPHAAEALLEAAVLLRSAGADPAPHRLARGATLELLTSLAAGNGVGASVQLFEEAVVAVPGDADRWSDLAAAHLVRSRTDGSAADGLKAIDVAARALEIEPRHAPASFNHALALERFGLRRTAVRAWDGYGAMDPGSAWAREAAARADRLAGPVAVRAAGPAGRESAAGHGAGTGRLDAGHARRAVLDNLLPAWGAHVITGSITEAERVLEEAAEIGAALARDGADLSATRAASEVRKGDAAGRIALARAYAAYGRARKAYDGGAYEVAARAFEEARDELPPGAPTLAGWIEFHRGTTLIYGGDFEGAEARLGALVEATDPVALPGLAGRTAWGLGSMDLRSGRYESAGHRFRTAAGLFEAAGELENLGAIRYLLAEVAMALGQSWSAVDSIAGALSALEGAGETVWLHNLLHAGAEHARSLGLLHAALALQDEGVAVASRIDNPIYHAEALLARSRTLVRAGRRADARADLALADSLLEEIDDPGARRWVANDRAHAAALHALADSGVAAAPLLEGVASFFATVGSTPRQAAALLDLATALEVAGRPIRRREVLGDILRLAEEQVAAASTFPLRASLATVVREAMILAVDHDLDAGEPETALEVLARWSAMRMGRPGDSPGPTGEGLRPGPIVEADRPASPGQRARPASPGERARPAVPPGQAELTFLLTDAAVVVWLRIGSTLRFHRVPARGPDVRALVESTARAARLGAPEDEHRLALGRLHDLLIRPAFPPGRPLPGKLRIHAEGPLAAVPFAALYDGETGRYLIEEATIAFTAVPGGSPAAEVAGWRSPSGARALVVAADSFHHVHPELPALPWTRSEATAVAGAYRNPTVLTGAQATPEAMSRAAGQADVLHFAGHAVVESERPWESRLVMAPGAPGGRAALDAREIGRAFAGLRVVVLAACRSASPHAALAEGFTGFADALLAGGVQVAIGSVWDVPDRDASRMLTRFHELLASGADPAEALRDAQMDQIRSADASERSPAAWAAFRAVLR